MDSVWIIIVLISIGFFLFGPDMYGGELDWKKVYSPELKRKRRDYTRGAKLTRRIFWYISYLCYKIKGIVKKYGHK